MSVALAGLGLTVLVTGALVAAFGWSALLPAGLFGLLATAIQLVAHRLVRRRIGAPFAEFGKWWAIGMGLRLGGVALVGAAAALAPARFAPLPTAFGFLGVLVPLLFMEMRLAR